MKAGTCHPIQLAAQRFMSLQADLDNMESVRDADVVSFEIIDHKLDDILDRMKALTDEFPALLIDMEAHNVSASALQGPEEG